MVSAVFSAARDPDAPLSRTRTQPAGESPLSARTSVLVVDDDPSVRMLLSYVLADGNRDIRLAATATEANELAEQLLPDVVIADVVMPGRSGLELRRDLASRFPGLPVILISGYSPQQVAEFVSRTPDTSFLPKPFNITQLLELVDRAVHPNGAA